MARTNRTSESCRNWAKACGSFKPYRALGQIQWLHTRKSFKEKIKKHLLSIANIYTITSSTRTRRGGSCLKDIYKTFLIYRTCMRRAPAKPVRACTLRNWCPLSHVTFEAPLRPSHFSLHSSHSTLHTSHFTHHTSHFTLHSSQSTLHTSHSTLHTSHFTLLTSHCFLHTPHFTLQSATRDSRTAWNYAHRNNHSLQNT